MNRRVILITGCDAGYFSFVQGTILSLRALKPGRQISLGFLDVGCTDEQRQWLRTQVDEFREADWSLDFPGRAQQPRRVQALLARPFLRSYFSGYDVYLWLDADAWIQDNSALELFIRGTERRGLVIVPELDRGNRQLYGFSPTVWKYFRHLYEQSYGQEVAQELCSYPMLNSGAIALRADAPHWQRWADNLAVGLQRGFASMIDQLALNLVVYARGGLFNDTELLPAWCNWTTHYGMPAWDRPTARFVEPYLPHTPIGILHLTGKPKPERAVVATTDGGQIEVSVRYGLPLTVPSGHTGVP